MADHLGFHDDTTSTLKPGGQLPEFTVKAHAVNHSTDTSYRTAMTISILSGGGSLGGTTTKACSSGVSTFSDITISGTEGTVVLIAVSGEGESALATDSGERGSVNVRDSTKCKSTGTRAHLTGVYGFQI